MKFVNIEEDEMKFTFQIIEGSEIWLILTDTMDPRSSQDDLISSNNESQTLDSNSKQTMERFNILLCSYYEHQTNTNIFPFIWLLNVPFQVCNAFNK